MDRAALFLANRALFVDRVANHVHDAAQSFVAHRHGDRPVGVFHFLSANQALGGVHRNGAHSAFAQVLRHFEPQIQSDFCNSFDSASKRRRLDTSKFL